MRDAGLAPGARVLDVGCGPGTLARLAFAHIGVDGCLVGLDRDEAFLAQAREEHAGRNATFLHADLSGALRADIGTFDAIIGRRVLMYLPDPAASLRRLAAHLRPGASFSSKN